MSTFKSLMKDIISTTAQVIIIRMSGQEELNNTALSVIPVKIDESAVKKGAAVTISSPKAQSGETRRRIGF